MKVQPKKILIIIIILIICIIVGLLIWYFISNRKHKCTYDTDCPNIYDWYCGDYGTCEKWTNCRDNGDCRDDKKCLVTDKFENNYCVECIQNDDCYPQICANNHCIDKVYTRFMTSGNTINSGGYITNGTYKATMGDNGNFCLTGPAPTSESTVAPWCTDTNNGIENGPYQFVFTGDIKLSVIDKNENELWYVNFQGNTSISYTLTLDDTGHLVITDSTGASICIVSDKNTCD